MTAATLFVTIYTEETIYAEVTIYAEETMHAEAFFWSFSSHSRMFHSFGDVTIASEGLQILTYARHL